MRFVLPLFFIFFCALRAEAFSPNAQNIYIGGGVSMPVGLLKDGWNTGYHGKVAAGFVVATTARQHVLELMLETSYHSFEFKEFGTNTKGGVASTYLLGLGPRVSFAVFPSRLNIFLGVIVGAAYVELTDLSFPGSDFKFTGVTARRIVVNPSVGIEVGKQGVISIGQVLIDTGGDPLSFTPVTIGIRF